VFTDPVELIGIEPSAIGTFESLAELDVEDFEALPANGFAVLAGFSKSQAIAPHFRMNAGMARSQWQGWRICGKGEFHEWSGTHSEFQRNPVPDVRNHESSIRQTL
jgi:hypothetical protein